MKNLLWFLASFLFFSVLCFSCSTSYALTAWKSPDGKCWAPVYIETYVYNPSCTVAANHTNGIVASNTGLYVGWADVSYNNCDVYNVTLTGYWWNSSNSTWTQGESQSSGWRSSDWTGTARPQLDAVAGGPSSYPSVYWPDGPGDLDSCSDPSVDCSEFEGTVVNGITLPGSWSPGDMVCLDECQLQLANDITAHLNDCDGDTAGDQPCTVAVDATYTGENCETGDAAADPDNRDCNDKEDWCDKICMGDTSGFTCNSETGVFECGCDFPDYPQVENDQGQLKPDQDNDGLPTGDPAETDADNDGQPDTTDEDPDGDGITKGDGDPDGDGNDNRGIDTNKDDPSGTWATSHNGYGTDSDGDNDGDQVLNCDDDDIDGDGIPNDQDPDMDGDGIPNTSDVDADGCDGVDGAGEGEEGDNAADADTDGDGDVDADDPPAGDGDGDGSGDWPTEEEVNTGVDGVTNNTYDPTIEGIPEVSDFQQTAQDFIDNNPFKSYFEDSEIDLRNSDPCVELVNIDGSPEYFCFDRYDSQFKGMGFVLVGCCLFAAFRIIKG